MSEQKRTAANTGEQDTGGGSDSRKPSRNPRSRCDAGNPASNHAPNFAPKTSRLTGGLRLVLPIFTAVLAVFAHSNGAVAGTSNGVLRVSARVEYGCNIAGKDVRCGGASGPASSVQLYPNLPASSPKFGAGVLEVVF